MNKTFRISTAAVTVALEKSALDSAGDSLTDSLVTWLRRSISTLETKQPDAVIAKSVGEPVWQAILDLVKNVGEAMMGSLPNFWKVSNGCIDGKFKKVRLTVMNLRYNPYWRQAFIGIDLIAIK
ncbi:hypothetical protein HHX47_DHR2000914 [Lentinula edodes]|nr:hypothetical protein HHX47_DHR2000914 [Lentinula edodes]